MVPLLNELYTSEWNLYHNFFIPSVKLINKKREHSKIIKKFDKAKTPYQRVLEADPTIISEAKKEQLRTLKASLNPFALRKAMETKLAKAMRYAYLTGNINSEATNQIPNPNG